MSTFGRNVRWMCVLLLVSFCGGAVPGRLCADDDAKSDPAAKPTAAAKTEVPAPGAAQAAGVSKPILQGAPVVPAKRAGSTSGVSGSTTMSSDSGSTLLDSTNGPGTPDEMNAGLPTPVTAEPGSGVRTVAETEQAPPAGEAPANNQEPKRRALPAPLDGVFPGF